MPPQNTGPAFGPQDYSQGPFSDQLKPPTQATIPVPGAKIPRAAAAAALIDKFLEGITTGRVRAFENQERQRAQKRGALDSAYNQVRQDLQEGRITQDGYQKATQIYFKAIGNLGMQDLDGGQDQSGKKKSGKKQATDQPPTTADHIKNTAKTFFTGLAGGKLTPGLDVGHALIDMQNSVYSKDGNPLPQYNAQTQIADVQKNLTQAADAVKPDATRGEAAKIFQPYFDKLDAIDPSGKQGKQARQDFLSRFQSAPAPPPPGSPEYNRTHLDEVQKQIQQVMGRPLTDAEKSQFALGQYGLKPSQNITYGPKSSGGDLTFDFDAQGNPRDPNKTYVEKQEGSQSLGWQPVQVPKPQAKTADDRAFGAYAEKHKLAIPPGKNASDVMTDSQQMAALKEAKESMETDDVKAMRELTMATRQLQMQQIADGRASVGTMADAIQDGNQLPDMAGIPRAQQSALRAELEKRGYNLRDAQMDLLATKSFMRTMNGPRQVQLRQAIEFAVPTLDKVQDLSDDLSKYLKRDKNQPLSRANLALAMAGAPGYSQEAKQAAILLNQQITDVQSEIAQIYSAGGASTNKKLDQAMQILNSAWDAKTLKSAIDLAHTNLQLRVNSIKNALPIGPDGEIKPLEAPKDFSTNPFAASGQTGTGQGGTAAPSPPGAGAVPPNKKDDKDPWKNPFVK